MKQRKDSGQDFFIFPEELSEEDRKKFLDNWNEKHKKNTKNQNDNS